MKFFSLLVAASLGSFVVCSQQLTLYPTYGGAHFEYQKDTVVYQVSPRQVAQILYDDPTAYAEFKKARTSSTLSAMMGFVGAGLIIIPTATAVVGGDPEWAFVAGGAALIIGSIPISINYRRRAQRAVELFNQKHSAIRPNTHLFFSGTGVRLVIRF